MNKKILLIFAAVAIVIAAAVGVYAYRNVQEAPQQAVEQENTPHVSEVDKTTTQVLKSGAFKDIDVVHKGSGTASIITTPEGVFLKFENFTVTPGPDLFVYASPNTANEGLGDFAVISPLKSTEGEQLYSLPDDYERYKSIVIWCRSFGVTFSTADLR